ncbi:uncharacterized protein CEXT_734211 [Caerostris extrusa]|uniref:RIIa domain-containing protein n=1 Tax=Caerostris extrusa TaxID=172846 RepID=A0AAV4MHP4_CAEEX|nr:uncharacterized protein CEXT_734211 [Caerostris extrusa]
MEHIFLDDQITIPEDFPFILKDYAKAAIKTDPPDLVEWSISYFTALQNEEVPPARDRLPIKRPQNIYLTTLPESLDVKIA